MNQAANAPQNAINLALLSSGLLKIVVVGGVASFSTAAAGADYQAPISGTPGVWPSTFAPPIATTSILGGVLATTNPGGWYENGINPDGSLSYGESCRRRVWSVTTLTGAVTLTTTNVGRLRTGGPGPTARRRSPR